MEDLSSTKKAPSLGEVLSGRKFGRAKGVRSGSEDYLWKHFKTTYFRRLDFTAGQSATTNPKNKKAPLEGLRGSEKKQGP